MRLRNALRARRRPHAPCLNFKLLVPSSHPTPQSYIGTGETRPKLEAIEDELDQWGRPKKAARTPIDAMPEDAQEKLRAEWDKQGAGASREE